jgi:cytochrome c oxidase assembly protein subunit 15
VAACSARRCCSLASAGVRGAAAATGRAAPALHSGGAAQQGVRAALVDLRRQYGFAAGGLAATRPAARHGPAGRGGAAALPARLGPALRRGKATLAAGMPAAAAAKAAATAAASAPSAAFGAAALTAGLTAGQRRALTWWLGGCSAWVAVLIILGGVTRLTRSGLSMTEWKLTGEAPPGSAAEWEAEFARYRASPEYRRVNASMDVDGFKFIYWMEWAHRMWGRGLGLAFALPAVGFVAAGAATAPLARRGALLMLMGGAQGLVGWWMVRSGLQEPENNAVPRVSPYRLAAHLTSAFAIYATLVWTTLCVALPAPPGGAAGPAGARAAAALYRLALPVAALVGVTAVSGAFVAGLDAGRAFNTFPLMGGSLVPDEYWGAVPGWRNAFENTAAVQLHHRALAASTLAAVGAMWAAGRRAPALPRPARLLLHAVAGAAGAQVALGVTTLLACVPPALGSAHQAGALTLFTLVLGLLYCARPAPAATPLRLLAARWTAPAAAAAVVGVGAAVVKLN